MLMYYRNPLPTTLVTRKKKVMLEELEAQAKANRAWLLDFGKGLQAAVGMHEMSQVLISPTLYQIPCTPFYCNEVVIWQQRILPVLDVNSLFEGQKILLDENGGVIGLAMYQPDPQESPTYGCFYLSTTPTSIFVNDETACDLPAQQRHWEHFAISCFVYNNAAIPIIDLNRLFSPEISKLHFRRPSSFRYR
jgi:hypothetical protein